VAVDITQTANPAGVTAVSSVTTYSAASTGTAAPDRTIVVLIGKEVATVTASSATINDGSGVKSMTSIGGTTFGNMGAWIYRAFCPTGTSADIAITWSGAITNVQNHIAVYAITDAVTPPSFNGTNTSTDMDATAPLTTGSTTIATGGGMIAVAVGAADAVAKTWANLTEDIDADAGDFRFTTATSITAGTATRTCTGGTNGEDGVLVWAHFINSELPPSTVMPPYRPR
jgi:hypothetical protein